MEKHLNTPVKEVIAIYPEAGKILAGFGVGCVSCAVGSCLLKDVVSIHNLPSEQEHELMYRIEKAIYPQRNVIRPAVETKAKKAAVKELKYSPPIKKLVDEHVLIKQVIDLIPVLVKKIDFESGLSRQLVADSLYFIRFYADKFHHAKEEEVLFNYADKNSDIVKVMLSDHDNARNHVKLVALAIEQRDRAAAIGHLLAYRDLLFEHIKKEDEILYPWIDRNLSMGQVGELFAAFNAAEENTDKVIIKNCEKIAQGLEQRVKINEEI